MEKRKISSSSRMIFEDACFSHYSGSRKTGMETKNLSEKIHRCTGSSRARVP